VSRGAGGDDSDDGVGWEEGMIGDGVNDDIGEGTARMVKATAARLRLTEERVEICSRPQAHAAALPCCAASWFSWPAAS
jgi:hypothetical protein